MSNVISFIGTLSRDAEVKVTKGGTSVLSFSCANNNGFGDRQTTNWFRVSLFGKRAEGQLQSYLKKGQQVFVSGELNQNEYKTNDGTTKTSLEVVANIVDLVGRKQEGAPPERQQNQSQPAHDNFDDDIPF